MTMHYGKNLKELTADDVWFGAQMNSNDGKSFIPGAYGTFSEADAYAYDAWKYLEYLKRGGTKTSEEWTSNIEDIERRQMYVSLLTEVVKLSKMP